MKYILSICLLGTLFSCTPNRIGAKAGMGWEIEPSYVKHKPHVQIEADWILK